LSIFTRARKYFTHTIFTIDPEQVKKPERFFFKILKTAALAVRGFGNDSCRLRASALTYLTVLSVVPFAAVALGIARGFGLGRYLESQLEGQTQWQQDVIDKIIVFARSMLETAQGGIIIGVGLVLLLWLVISGMANIEKAFNKIWKIRKSRTIVRKFTDYFATIVVGLILFLIAGALTVTGGAAGTVLGTIMPFLAAWILFAFVYEVVPYQKIPVFSAIAGGIMAGTMFEVLQWAYVTFQIGIARYNAIYGGFAALPLFVAWLHFSWMIILFGAEFAYSRENLKTYGFGNVYSKLNMRSLKIIALQISRELVVSKEELSVHSLSGRLQIPAIIVKNSLDLLVNAGLVTECLKDSSRFYRSLFPEKIKAAEILTRIELTGKEVPKGGRPDRNEIKKYLETFDIYLNKFPENTALVSLKFSNKEEG